MRTRGKVRWRQREEASQRELLEQRAAAERERVQSQRAMWEALPHGEAKDTLRLTLLERAWVLLDAGEAQAADALLEFLPERDAGALLDEFFETGISN